MSICACVQVFVHTNMILIQVCIFACLSLSAVHSDSEVRMYV